MLFFFIRFCKPVPADLALIAYHLKLKTENSNRSTQIFVSKIPKILIGGWGVTRSVLSGPRCTVADLVCAAAHALTLPFLFSPPLPLPNLT